VRRLSLTLSLLLLAPLSTLAQAVRFQSQVIGNRGLPLGSQNVAVCTQPAVTNTTPCSPLATLATSAITNSGGANPTTTDVNGNFFFYLPTNTGKVTIQIYGPQVATPFVQPDVVVPADLSQNLTLSGNNTFTGANTFSTTGSTTVCIANSVLNMAPGCFAGADIMAQIQAAYNSTGCPTSTSNTTTGAGGCEIFVPPQAGGGCYTATTPVTFSTNLRFVLLRGDPNGATCVNWTPTTGTMITADTGSPITNALYYNNSAVVIKDIQFSGSGPGNSTVAIQWGSVNG